MVKKTHDQKKKEIVPVEASLTQSLPSSEESQRDDGALNGILDATLYHGRTGVRHFSCFRCAAKECECIVVFERASLDI
jgi:hypothetical protein